MFAIGLHNVTLFLLEVATYPERRVEDQSRQSSRLSTKNN
jgi:hypothetical protein